MPHGLYVHVPWCRSICPYCAFNVYRLPKSPAFAALVDAMLREMRARRALFEGPLRSLYLGGGTPSLLPSPQLGRLIAGAKHIFGFTPEIEITLEADPGTVDEPALRALRGAGVNRLSIGWQSTHETLLRRLGRAHGADAGARIVAAARAAGFENISLDLIFAVPGQTLAMLAQDLERLVALAPPHVSLYAMSYHPGTPFARRVARGTLTPADEELELAMTDRITQALGDAGIVRYEVSNFAVPGRESAHNAAYWQGTPYVGIGPGAHSFHQTHASLAHRWENVRAPAAYLAAWATDRDEPAPPADPSELVSFSETLDGTMLRLERIMLGLRLVDGFALDALTPQAPSTEDARKLGDAVAELERRGWAHRVGNRCVPTPLGLNHADAAALVFD